VAGIEQAPHHDLAHAAEPDKSNFHCPSPNGIALRRSAHPRESGDPVALNNHGGLDSRFAEVS
jgi:hypothetical protein